MKGNALKIYAVSVLAAALFPAVAFAFLLDGKRPDEVIGSVQYYVYKKGDRYADIARAFDVGVQALLDANRGLQRQRGFKAGDRLVIPAAHVLPSVRDEGIVINLAELRLYLFRQGLPPASYPITVGKKGWETPLGHTSILRKRANPVWVPTPSLRAEDPTLPEAIPPGPDNPLGAFALNLGWPGFAIHGTNAPDSIGKRASHGCIRMYPEDIEDLFGKVERDTRVTVVHEPVKLGWQGNKLYLQLSAARERPNSPNRRVDAFSVYTAVAAVAGRANVLWPNVTEALEARNGVTAVVAVRGGAKSGELPPKVGMNAGRPPEGVNQ